VLEERVLFLNLVSDGVITLRFTPPQLVPGRAGEANEHFMLAVKQFTHSG
jgi:hypothetical protein